MTVAPTITISISIVCSPEQLLDGAGVVMHT
jgi:hypothetical protein